MESSRKFPRVPEGSQWGENTWITVASIACSGGTCTVSRVALLTDGGAIVGSVVGSAPLEEKERHFASMLDAINYCSSKENIVWLCTPAETAAQLLGACRDEGLLYDEAGSQITDPDLPQYFLFERRPMTPDGEAVWEQLQTGRKLYLRVPVPAMVKAKAS